MLETITSLIRSYNRKRMWLGHSSDSGVIMGAMASLAFVRRIHRWPVNSPHKWPVMQRLFPLDDFIKWKHFPHYWPFVRGIHGLHSLYVGQFVTLTGKTVLSKRCIISTCHTLIKVINITHWILTSWNSLTTTDCKKIFDSQLLYSFIIYGVEFSCYYYHEL